MSPRSYDQHCGVAHALDVVGERWTLLLLRELLLGPKRYRDLLARLPGIGTNLLAARLRMLEDHGVIRQTVLPPPAGVAAYELTDRGRELRPAMEALALWGYSLLPERPGAATASASWAAMTMCTAMMHGGGPGFEAVVQFDVGDETFWLDATPVDAEVHDGPAPGHPDLVVTADPAGFFAVAQGRVTAARALREGTVALTGDRRLFTALMKVFRLPPRPVAA